MELRRIGRVERSQGSSSEKVGILSSGCLANHLPSRAHLPQAGLTSFPRQEQMTRGEIVVKKQEKGGW